MDCMVDFHQANSCVNVLPSGFQHMPVEVLVAAAGCLRFEACFAVLIPIWSCVIDWLHELVEAC